MHYNHAYIVLDLFPSMLRLSKILGKQISIDLRPSHRSPM
jgi:hypothetical protein